MTGVPSRSLATLALGVLVLAGCEATASTTESTTTGAECMSSEDCGPNSVCSNGICLPDLPPPVPCLEDRDCGPYQVCLEDGCYTPTLELCGIRAAENHLVTATDDIQIILFAELSSEGDEELVVITDSRTQVFRAGQEMPTTLTHDFDGQPIDAAVSGQFDDTEGEDLLVLFDGDLYLYRSNGNDGFSSLVIEPSPVPDAVDMIAADLDGEGHDDLIWFTPDGVSVALADQPGAPLALDGTLRDIEIVTETKLDPSIALLSDTGLQLFGTDGAALGAPYPQTPPIDRTQFAGMLGADRRPLYVTLGRHQGYGVLESYSVAGGLLDTTVVLDGQDVFGADIDGDGVGEPVFSDSSGSLAYIKHHSTEDACFVWLLLGAIAQDPIVGDYDGDGADDIAFIQDSRSVWISDPTP